MNAQSAMIQALRNRREIIVDVVDGWRVRALATTLNREWKETARLIPGWHQLFCLPAVPTRELSSDGYEPTFAPSAPYVARMWGGSSIDWEVDQNTSLPFVVRAGDSLQRTSFIGDIQLKEGKKSGPLLLMKVCHEYARQTDQQVLVKESTSMIYRTQPFSMSENVSQKKASSRHQEHFEIVELGVGEWSQRVPSSSVLLFRYSALTFNAHMIHYDQSYSNSEGFSQPLVHGPLQAQLLLDLVDRIEPNRQVKHFSYRGKREKWLFLSSDQCDSAGTFGMWRRHRSSRQKLPQHTPPIDSTLLKWNSNNGRQS